MAHAFKLIATRDLRMSRALSRKAQITVYWDVRVCMKCGKMEIRDKGKGKWEDRMLANISGHDAYFYKVMTVLVKSIRERADGKTCEAV